MSELAEYLRRNGVVARAYGAQAAVEQAAERAARLKRPPKWLLALLAQAHERMPDVIAEVVAHRDEERAAADDFARRFEAARRRQA